MKNFGSFNNLLTLRYISQTAPLSGLQSLQLPTILPACYASFEITIQLNYWLLSPKAKLLTSIYNELDYDLVLITLNHI